MNSTITEAMLKSIMPFTPRNKRVASLPIINATAFHYGIVYERRLAAWLATLAVESGELRYQEEIANGDAYEGRVDLGNTVAGDGRRFKGHGRIQITGRANHKSYTDYLRDSGHLPFVDFVKNPKALAQEPYATDSAGWFFAVHIKANELADNGEFLKIQVKVNGRNKKTGLPNHWQQRQAYYARALAVIPDDFTLIPDEDIDVNSLPDSLHSEAGYPDFDPVERETHEQDRPAESARGESAALETAPAATSDEAQQTQGEQPQAMAQVIQNAPNAAPLAPPPTNDSDNPIKIVKDNSGKLMNWLAGFTGLGTIGAILKDNALLIVVAFVSLVVVVLTIYFVNKYFKYLEAKTAADTTLNTVKFVTSNGNGKDGN